MVFGVVVFVVVVDWGCASTLETQTNKTQEQTKTQREASVVLLALNKEAEDTLIKQKQNKNKDS